MKIRITFEFGDIERRAISRRHNLIDGKASYEACREFIIEEIRWSLIPLIAEHKAYLKNREAYLRRKKQQQEGDSNGE